MNNKVNYYKIINLFLILKINFSLNKKKLFKLMYFNLNLILICEFCDLTKIKIYF